MIGSEGLTKVASWTFEPEDSFSNLIRIIRSIRGQNSVFFPTPTPERNLRIETATRKLAFYFLVKRRGKRRIVVRNYTDK